jgi:hypothetical protein
MVCVCICTHARARARTHAESHRFWKVESTFDFRKSVVHHTIQINQPTRCSCFSRVYYSTFMCGSTCFGRLPAHHQEHTAALGASGSTFGRKRPERCWSWSGQTTTNNSSRFLPKVEPEAPNAVVCSWWWAERRTKHVEPHMNVE